MIPEPLPNIADQVRMHADRALILSELERLPPGYTKVAWAVLLMDNDYNRLLARYTRKVAAEKLRLPEDQLHQLAREGQSFLPAVPPIPPELVAKSREVYTKWLAGLVEQECLNALLPLVGSKRDVLVLGEAQHILSVTLDSMAEQLGPVPFTARVTMNKEGGFTLTVQGKPPRRSLR